MKTAILILLYIHIAAGFTSLILFWIPAFTKKGNKLHRSSGKWYVRLMWVVVVSAAILSIHNAIIGRTNMALFLGFISILTANPLWYGIAILRYKKELSRQYIQIHRLFNIAQLAFGLFLVVYGWFYVGSGVKYLMTFFGVIGVTGLFEIIRSYKMLDGQTQWYKKHYTGMIISGIASYTAFFSFGGSKFFNDYLVGNLQLIPWIAPTVVGTMSLIILRTYYRKKGVIK